MAVVTVLVGEDKELRAAEVVGLEAVETPVAVVVDCAERLAEVPDTKLVAAGFEAVADGKAELVAPDGALIIEDTMDNHWEVRLRT